MGLAGGERVKQKGGATSGRDAILKTVARGVKPALVGGRRGLVPYLSSVLASLGRNSKKDNRGAYGRLRRLEIYRLRGSKAEETIGGKGGEVRRPLASPHTQETLSDIDQMDNFSETGKKESMIISNFSRPCISLSPTKGEGGREKSSQVNDFSSMMCGTKSLGSGKKN